MVLKVLLQRVSTEQDAKLKQWFDQSLRDLVVNDKWESPPISYETPMHVFVSRDKLELYQSQTESQRRQTENEFDIMGAEIPCFVAVNSPEKPFLHVYDISSEACLGAFVIKANQNNSTIRSIEICYPFSMFETQFEVGDSTEQRVRLPLDLLCAVLQSGDTHVLAKIMATVTMRIVAVSTTRIDFSVKVEST